MSYFCLLLCIPRELKCVLENERTENSCLNRRETGEINLPIPLLSKFTFFLGAGEGGTDFLASLTDWASDEFRELAAAGEM